MFEKEAKMNFEKIHEDDRGGIYALASFKYDEIVMFRTNEGYARGGCVHPISDEYFCVVEGMVELTIKNQDGTDSARALSAGQSVTIPCNTPHYFYSIVDSLVMEWGPAKEEKNVRNPDFRKKVEEINAKKVSK